ncbi:hypothetical protein FGG08_007464, partial [Glutinoglossum americanum]
MFKSGSKGKNEPQPAPGRSGQGNNVSKLQPRNLWGEAFQKLSQAQQDILTDGTQEARGSPEGVVATVIELTKNDYENYCSRGQETNIHTRAREILCCALKFNEIITSVLKFDPTGYGTILWSVVAGGLQIEAVFDSAAVVADYLLKYALVDKLYRDQPTDQKIEFEDLIMEVYAALLRYASKVKMDLSMSISAGVSASWKPLDDQKITELKNAIKIADRKVHNWIPMIAHQYRRQEFIQLDEKAEKMLVKIDSTIRHQQESEKKQILERLRNDEASNRQRELRRKVDLGNPGNHGQDKLLPGQWFLDLQKFSDWKSSIHTFLWMTGVSGCGKSSLCSTIIQHLIDTCKREKNKSLSYWYFDNRYPPTQNIFNMLSSLIQVAKSTKPIPNTVKDLQDPNLDIKTLCRVLQETILELNCDVYIVLDAIDQCSSDENVEPRDELLGIIKALVEAQIDRFHLLVSSTRQSFSAAFMDLAQPSEEVNIEIPIGVDLESYIDAAIKKYAADTGWDESTQAYIKRSLNEDKQKNFLITSARIESLRKCYDRSQIDIELAHIPHTIADMYEGMLKDIDRRNVPRVRRIFYWVSTAYRRLSQDEIAIAPGVDLLKSDIVSTICPQRLITLLEEQRNDQIVVVVQFYHASVKGFLSSQKVKESKHDPVPEFFISEPAAHAELAKSCLSYLLKMTQPQLPPQILKENPFLSYSAKYWHMHLKEAKASGTGDGAITSKLLDLFKSPMTPSFLNWMRIASPESTQTKFDLSANECPSPLYVALLLELPNLVRKLIEDCAYVNAPGGKLGTPLQLSISRGNVAVVQQLLSKGAKVESSQEVGEVPLYIAASRGDHNIVQMLLEAKANPDGKSGEFGTALQVACYGGFGKVVEHLLDSGADVNEEGGLFGTALQAASAAGYGEIVDELLTAGANISVTSGLLGSAIQAAITGGHSHVVSKLASSRADLDPNGDVIWHDAFIELQMEKPAITKKIVDFILQETKIKQPLALDQLLLAAAVKQLNNLSQYTSIPIDLVDQHRKPGYETSNFHKLDTLVPRIYKNGREGMHHTGYLYKALFWAVLALSVGVLSDLGLRVFDEILGEICEVAETLLLRMADQEVIEADESKVYDGARTQLTKLYKVAFNAFKFVELARRQPKIFRILGSAMTKDFKIVSGVLRDQNRIFEDAMGRANLLASQKALESAISERVQKEVRGALLEGEARLSAELLELETRIIKGVRDALAEDVRMEIGR